MATSTRKNPKAGGEARVTPAMRQYFRFKKEHPDCILFFRMGDFYEMFYEDAVTAHKALGITLTERSEGVPMAGVPHHSVESYIRRMIEQGFKIAICDQVQDPKEAKGVVERAVTRVLTPGTLVDESLLADDTPNNLAAVAFLDSGDAEDAQVSAAIVELSTGEFRLIHGDARAVLDDLARRSVNEILYCETANGQTPTRVQRFLDALGVTGAARPSWHFRHGEALEAVCELYGVRSVAGFGLRDDDPAMAPAGAVVRFLHETQDLSADDGGMIPGRTGGATLSHLSAPVRETPEGYLAIDAATLRALEIERTVRGGTTDGSLVGVFSGAGGARTSMGKRLLREWLCRPLSNREEIEARHACVATLQGDVRSAESLNAALRNVQDVARIAGRLGLGRATPRDLVALGGSLSKLELIIESIDNAPAFGAHRESLESLRAMLTPMAAEIERVCLESPPAHLREGGVIRDGVDAELDEARGLRRDAGEWLAKYQQELIERHELPAIKVGFNRVFGYYIELSRAQSAKAPPEFTRKQTLKNAERYITPELKEFEEKVTTAEARAIERELALFRDLCAKAGRLAPAIAQFGRTVAELDCLGCFAQQANRRGWTRPTMVDEATLDIEQGRHPVLESLLHEQFVPNDIRLGTTESPASLALITGPNMAGKSTYIRQAALLVILAHAGSFVPATRAEIGVTDRVFSRVGADDALHAGQSTFMVEMTETANILHNATARSLIILDEIGRGTSTLDGLSLAWAIAESLAKFGKETRGPRTLFATHYHELTTLEEELPGRLTNLNVSVKEWGDEIVFLHRIVPGRADRSYGIHVAQLAGLPRAVVKRAEELLETLAVSHEGMPREISRQNSKKAVAPGASQPGLFETFKEHPALGTLRSLDLERMTPMEAFDALRALKKDAES